MMMSCGVLVQNEEQTWNALMKQKLLLPNTTEFFLHFFSNLYFRDIELKNISDIGVQCPWAQNATWGFIKENNGSLSQTSVNISTWYHTFGPNTNPGPSPVQCGYTIRTGRCVPILPEVKVRVATIHRGGLLRSH